jgi:hypothetical protein
LGRNQIVFTTSQKSKKTEGKINNIKDIKVKINMGQKFALENLCRGFSLELGFP